jgi:hypothetical protein
MVPDEIEYFSMHLTYPIEWYLDHFARAAKAALSQPGPPRVIGEKSARYCSITPDRIELVRCLLPDVKLILMTRDPVARHWSQAKRFFRSAGSTSARVASSAYRVRTCSSFSSACALSASSRP